MFGRAQSREFRFSGPFGFKPSPDLAVPVEGGLAGPQATLPVELAAPAVPVSVGSVGLAGPQSTNAIGSRAAVGDLLPLSVVSGLAGPHATLAVPESPVGLAGSVPWLAGPQSTRATSPRSDLAAATAAPSGVVVVSGGVGLAGPHSTCRLPPLPLLPLPVVGG